LVILLAACASGPADLSMAGTQWQLISIGEQPLAAGMPAPTARFQVDGKLQGSAGCNSYFTTYQAKDKQITLQMIAKTDMACSPASLMDLEDRFIKALGKTKGYQGLNNQLQLIDGTGQVLLTFAPLSK
jgi:heat shock protein HslJ